MAKAMTLFWVLVIIAMALVVGTAALDARRLNPCLTNGDCSDTAEEDPCDDPCLTESDCSDDGSSVCCKVGACPPDASMGWCTHFFCYVDEDCHTDNYVCKEIGQCGEELGYCEEPGAPAPAPN